MPKRPVQVEYRSLVIIWFALLVSQGLFVAIVMIVKPEIIGAAGSGDPLGDKPLIVLAFGAAAVAFFALSIILSRQHMRRAIVDHDQACVQTGLVLGCALSEVCSLLGLILAFVWSYPYFFLWMILGTLGIFINFPRKGTLQAAATQQE